MKASDSSREIAALTPYCNGNTLSFGASGAGTKAQWDPQEEGKPWPKLSTVATASIDSVLAVWELEQMPDPLACMAEWRRVLRQGGTMAVALHAAGTAEEPVRHTFTPGYLVALINRLGGFNISTIEDIEAGNSWVLIAERNHVAEIRSPLGTLSADLAGCAREHQDARAELYFQIGTVFLQAGDPEQAESTFKRMLAIESDNTHGLFGLAMSYGGQGRWNEAQVELQRVVESEPTNEEATRWLNLAVERTKGATGTAKKQFSPAAPRAGSLRV